MTSKKGLGIAIPFNKRAPHQADAHIAILAYVARGSNAGAAGTSIGKNSVSDDVVLDTQPGAVAARRLVEADVRARRGITFAGR